MCSKCQVVETKSAETKFWNSPFQKLLETPWSTSNLGVTMMIGNSFTKSPWLGMKPSLEDSSIAANPLASVKPLCVAVTMTLALEQKTETKQVSERGVPSHSYQRAQICRDFSFMLSRVRLGQ